MDKEIYKLNRDLSEPDVGPCLDAGELVYLVEWSGDFALVRSCVDHEDPGNGEGEPVMTETVSWVSAEDLEPVE